MKDGKEMQSLIGKEHYSFSDLLEVMRLLRAEGGCPWDREQTHKSIRSCLIEETYEVVEAIDTENALLLREELGDLLFQVVFHAQIKSEEGVFDIEDVTNDICVKMIHRHPHVFGEESAETSGEVLRNWEKIKTEEKQRIRLADKLRAIPPMLPALMRASKVAKKTADVDAVAGGSSGLHDACKRWMESIAEGSEAEKVAVGDLLYLLCADTTARGIDAEEALSAAVKRRIGRVEAEEGHT